MDTNIIELRGFQDALPCALGFDQVSALSSSREDIDGALFGFTPAPLQDLEDGRHERHGMRVARFRQRYAPVRALQVYIRPAHREDVRPAAAGQQRCQEEIADGFVWFGSQ